MTDRRDHLAALIQRRMSDKNWSVRDVARQSRGQVGHSTVNNYARGKGTMPPPMKVIQGLADGLQIPFRDVWDAVSQTLIGNGGEGDRLAQFSHLTSDDIEEILELAKIRNDRRRRWRQG